MTADDTTLLQARGLRVDALGAPLCEGISFEADAQRLVVHGAGARAIFSAIAGRAVVVAGELRVGGWEVGNAEHAGRVGIATLDPALPPRTSVLDHVALSLRLSGFKQAAARAHARSIISDLAMSDIASRLTESLSVAERRAVVIARALLPDAHVICLESPLAGLEGPAAKALEAVVERVTGRMRVIWSAERIDESSAERATLRMAELLMIIGRDGVRWSGEPAELDRGQHVAIVVRGEPEGFIRKLRREQFAVEGEAPRLRVLLPEGAHPSSILRIATESDVVVVEMTPLFTPG